LRGVDRCSKQSAGQYVVISGLVSRQYLRLTAPTVPGGISHPRRGFTLHELLVTLVIMVVMCSVVLAAIEPALEEARLRAVTSMVVGHLQFARSYAISHRTPTAVFFDTTTLGIAVVSAEEATEQTNAQVNATNESSTAETATSGTNWQPITTPSGLFQALPTGVTITDVSLSNAVLPSTGATVSTPQTETYTPVEMSGVVPFVNGNEETGQLITFSALGQGQDASITIQDARGHSRTILVDAITGRCDLANPNNDQTTPVLPNP
jgi:prepilin-type N-terminal cleavage/methylation domain-containing protein